ncbi:MAG: GNAT family N-acetyltransferase [bacterium]
MQETISDHEQQETSPFKTLELKNAPEIQNYFDWANPMLRVTWDETTTPEEYRPDYIVTHPDETVVLGVYEDQTLVAGGKVTILSDEEKKRLEPNTELHSEKSALLEYVAVKEESRNKHILLDLIERRTKWAEDHGVKYLYSELELDNPISSVPKVHNGFKMYSVHQSGAGISTPYLVLRKNLSETTVKTESPETTATEKKEILVTEDSYDELAHLFEDGWVGVDITIDKPIKTVDQISPDEIQAPWKLTLERAPQE